MTTISVAYPKALKALLDGDVDLLSDTIKIQALEGGTYNAAHDFLDDLSGATKVGSAVTLGGKATTSGRFTVSNPDVSLPAGHTVDSFVVYVDAGSDATRRLLCFIGRKADGSAIAIVTSGATRTLRFAGGLIFSIGGA